VGSKLFYSLGVYLQKDGFTHVRGKAPEVELEKKEVAVLTWNVRGYGGGLHYDHGVVHWRSRIDGIVDQILKERPHVVVLQEVADISMREALIERLQDVYAHFYIHLQESNCIVITQCAVAAFSFTPLVDSKLGFSTLEIKASKDARYPAVRIIGTQLSDAAEEIRYDQIDQIIQSVAKQKLAIPTLLVGSLHIDRATDTILSQYLAHTYLKDAATHSGQLAKQWSDKVGGFEDQSDYISFFKPVKYRSGTLPVAVRGVRLYDSHLVEAFKGCDTKTALSDTHGVFCRFSFNVH
jgi:hypothetical protein